METQQIIGAVLILAVIGLYAYWIYITKKQTGVKAKEKEGVQVFDITVKGVYSPNVIMAKIGEPIKINFTRQEDSECSRYVVFSDFNIRKELPKNKTITIELNPKKSGEYSFACDMGMYQGKLIVERASK
jgi:plastocyanin domain-containing protein